MQLTGGDMYNFTTDGENKKNSKVENDSNVVLLPRQKKLINYINIGGMAFPRVESLRGFRKS